MFPTPGNDTLTGGSGNDTIDGLGGNDLINSFSGDDNLIGGDGNDILNAGLGFTDNVDGGAGIDILVVNYSTLTTDVNRFGSSYYTTGNRTFYSNIERFNLAGGSGNDRLFGDSLDDTLNGGVGNDQLSGGAGNDRIAGGTGNDIITQGAGADTVNGGAGTDTLIDADLSLLRTNLVLNVSGSTIAPISLSDGTTITGFEFFEDVTGGSGNDRISFTNTNAANNEVNGGDGNDILNAGLGFTDNVDGGAGIDILVVNYSTLTTDVNRFGSSYYTTGNRTFYSNIERFNLTGGSGNDRLLGDSLDDTLNGGRGNDQLIGGAGNDILSAGLGRADTVEGGAGTDVLVVNYSSLNASIVQSSTSIETSNNRTFYSNIERFNLTGGSGNDSLFGAALADTLSGGKGNDTLSGGAGNDILNAGLGLTNTVNGGAGTDLLRVDYSTLTTNINQTSTSIQTRGNQTTYSNIEQFNLTGGSGRDSLFGGASADTLSGGAGNDTLTGRAGNDILVGGSGNDILTGNSGADSFTFNAVNERIDTITDFVTVDDRIVVSAVGFGGGLTADAAITEAQFVLGTAAEDASQRFIYNTANGALSFDADGTGSIAGVQIAILSTNPSITRADIFVTV